MDPPNMDPLDLSDSDVDALFDTPAARKGKSKAQDDHDDGAEGAGAGKTRVKESHYTTEEAREAALRKELENVRNINRVIEGVVESLEKAKNNMNTVSRTVHNASTLLHTWTRILSQTEHNQRLILNPQWQGASQDLVDSQNEELYRQQAAERREAEEQARREAAARRAEEERRRAEAAAKAGPRGRGRGGARPRGATSSGYGATPSSYVGVGGQGGRGLNRSNSTGGRGSTSTGRGSRGRGRGLGP
ncbi:DASH complex subunit Duo1-domain-containing protein [Clohesyomyces aquaticus]|uniref:DASH complex subunit DUO1 n=1 Tax=Clohesyomyces aquaticus TaxID=1231657 RepID=A0A1Y1ZX94_9PLEO|nr:DASH complex subunit Duo1-domain-containing protein [Clohesyomyces aquaticus]